MDVHDAIDDQRRGTADRVARWRLERPLQRKIADVRGVNLTQLRVSTVAKIQAVKRPIRTAAGPAALALGGERRRRLAGCCHERENDRDESQAQAHVWFLLAAIRSGPAFASRVLRHTSPTRADTLPESRPVPDQAAHRCARGREPWADPGFPRQRSN